MNTIGPAPLELHLPPELAAVDPAGLRSRAGEHRTDAQAAAAQATALRTAVVRLVPAAWLGLGALSFASGALLQAISLEGIAAAGQDLADALDALAGRLEQARAEASAAVQSGRQLDEEVAADNAAWSRRPEPERPDPDPARVDGQVAAARLLATRLEVATAAAQQAWLQAGAAFDLVAYRMPALAEQMTGVGDDWRPTANLAAIPVAEWRRLAGPSPVCVGAGYGGAGALTGPDGRAYPLVVPWVDGDGVRWSGDLVDTDRGTSTLDGADPGWHEIGVRAGIDTFSPAATTAEKAAVVTAGLAGNAPRLVGRLRPDLLPGLQFSPGGVPRMGPGTAAVPLPRSGGTGQIPRSALVADPDGRLRWVPDTSKDPGADARTGQRQDTTTVPPGKVTPVAPNVVALVGSGLAGVSTAQRMDDSRTAAYRATFEENDDGRIRARLTLYQVRDGGAGPSVLATDLSMTPEGSVQRDPVRYRPSPTPTLQAEPGTTS